MKMQDSSFSVNFVRIIEKKSPQGIKYYLAWQSAEFDSASHDRNIYDKIVCYQVYDAITDTCLINKIKKRYTNRRYYIIRKTWKKVHNENRHSEYGGRV